MSGKNREYTDGQSPAASAITVFLLYCGSIAFAMYIGYSISPLSVYITIIPAGLVLILALIHSFGIYVERKKARKEADIELDRHQELLDALKKKDD
ncbi:hypothetical protein OM427_30600 [Halomonas sp. 18H]|nr:hypothetical protein [Halomonas sp. 18H]MCW4153854.1 hypothetical protein [Halomonas sp. 18H]